MSGIVRIVRMMEVAQRLEEGSRTLAGIDEDELAAAAREKASPGSGGDDLNLLTFAEWTTGVRQAPRPESESIVRCDGLSSCIASRSPNEQAGFATRKPAASSRSN